MRQPQKAVLDRRAQELVQQPRQPMIAAPGRESPLSTSQEQPGRSHQAAGIESWAPCRRRGRRLQQPCHGNVQWRGRWALRVLGHRDCM